MYRDNVGEPSGRRPAGSGLFSRVFNGLWRLMRHVWLIRSAQKLAATPFFWRIAERMADEDAADRARAMEQRECFDPLPGADLTEEERRQAADEIRRRQRIG